MSFHANTPVLWTQGVGNQTHDPADSTCCRGGWSSEDRCVIAQLGLNPIDSPEAGLWSEEGRGRPTVIGLLE